MEFIEICNMLIRNNCISSLYTHSFGALITIYVQLWKDLRRIWVKTVNKSKKSEHFLTANNKNNKNFVFTTLLCDSVKTKMTAVLAAR